MHHALQRLRSAIRLKRGCPLVSLVLAVKNGLPHLQETIEAVRRQTYRNFEVIAQDGGSTDGSVQYLESVRDLPKLEVVSEPDQGHGQAFNRGISRCRGDIVCGIACDEYLDDDALQRAVGWCVKYPNAAVVYGAARLADSIGRITQVFFPPPFDLKKVICNEVVPPMSAAFLNRAVLGKELRADESLKTCPDYDFWIRVGSRFGPDAIVMVPDPVLVARGDRASASYRVESFAQFCKDKLFVLDRYLRELDDDATRTELAKTGPAGILTWAAESVLALEGTSPAFLSWCEKAAAFDPQSARLLDLARRTLAFEIDQASGQFILRTNVQPEAPLGHVQPAEGLLNINGIRTEAHWEGAKVECGNIVRVVTGEQPWAYAALIPLRIENRVDRNRWHWVKLDVQALSGQIGVGLLADNRLSSEHLIRPVDGRVDLFVRLNPVSAEAVMIRNGSIPGSSVLEILGTTVVSGPQTSTLPEV